MRFGTLRRILARAVLATLPAAGIPACVELSCPSSSPLTERFVVLGATLDPKLEELRDRCVADAGDCLPLCEEVLERLEGFTDFYFIAECGLEERDGEDGVHIAYGTICEGRRPAGLLSTGEVAARSVVGSWLARAAHLEAASIKAFGDLARELRAHDAPPPLVRRALRAALDEIAHARLTSALAGRYGARPAAPEVEVRPGLRSLEAIAVDNAAEGCVRETWGALFASWQARAASDPAVRQAAAVIATDEARHAALGWAIDRFARSRLDAAGVRRMDQARRAAVEELATAAANEEPEPALIDLAGVPAAPVAAELVTRARVELWERS